MKKWLRSENSLPDDFDWSDYSVVACVYINDYSDNEIKENGIHGHCDMCGTMINNIYVLKNSNGDTKYLGCECVSKTNIKKVKYSEGINFSKKSIRKLEKLGIEIEEEFPF